MNNFYKDLLIEIQENINKNNFKEALNLIDDELKMPYVPMDIEEELIKFRNHIFLNHFNNKEVREISFQKYLDIFESEEISNLEKYEMVEVFSEFNLKEYLEYIKTSILENSRLDKFIKYKTLILMLEQKIDDCLDVKVNNEKKTFCLNKLRNYKENEQFVFNSSKIQELVFKEINILNSSLDILEKIFLVIAFENDLFTNKEIWKEIIFIVSKMLNRNDLQELILDRVDNLENFENNIKTILNILQFE